MVTNEQYQEIFRGLSNVQYSRQQLIQLKQRYKQQIASNRRLESCDTVFDFLKLLEKRDVINEDSMVLREIAAQLGKSDIIDTILSLNRTQPIVQVLPVTRDIYERITGIIGRDIGYKWKDFARALHFREGEIDNLESRHRDVPDRIRDVINAYKAKCPPYHFRTNILDALCEARRRDLSREIAYVMDTYNLMS